MTGPWPASAGSRIARIEASANRIPTDAPEADGTIARDATTRVLAQVSAGGHAGIGYTYPHAAAAIIDNPLRDVLLNRDADDIPGACATMNRSLRDIGADAELMVDANGAYDRKQALAFAGRWAGEGMTHDGALGGHLLERHVRPTLQVVVTEAPAHLRRRHDAACGLALIHRDQELP